MNEELNMCVKGRPCLLSNIHTDEKVSKQCCFECPRKETAAGNCPFFCSVYGHPRTRKCDAMFAKIDFNSRYSDVE